MTKSGKRLIASILFLTLIYFIARLISPPLIDQHFNRVVIPPPYKVSPEANAIYQSLDFIADLHSDVLLWRRDILKQHDYGHQDVPRMLQAKQALQAFTIVNKVPEGLNFQSNSDDSDALILPHILQGRPVKSWFNLTERVITQAAELHQFAADSNNQLSVIHNKQELKDYLLERQTNPEITAGFLGIEGAQALQGDLNNIEKVYQAGIRMIGLTHFFDNEVGGSAHGLNRGGLTEFGRQAIALMESKNILIDLSHASPALIDDLLSIATKPVIVSHTGVKGTCNNNRNLSDKQLKKIAENGGLIGIAMFKVAVCGTTPAHIAQSIFYTANLIGAQHVALGSDFDGAVNAIIEVRGLPLIVEELIKLGMPPRDIRLVMGDNVKHFLLTNLPD